MKETEIYCMLPQTKHLLEQDIEERRSEVADISRQGAELWEGDQWHSKGFREQQRKKELAIRFLQMIDQKSGRIEVLDKPKQNDHIEVGHMAKIKLLDDPDVIEANISHSTIHILSSEDALYLGKLFDNLSEMIVSLESPIGSALLGKKRGEIATYLDRNRLQILNDEDAITASNLFDKNNITPSFNGN